jgi:hypothetical protein
MNMQPLTFKDYYSAVMKYMDIVGQDSEAIPKRVAWRIYQLIEPRFMELDYAIDVRVIDGMVDQYSSSFAIPLSEDAKRAEHQQMYRIIIDGTVGSAYYLGHESNYYLLPRTDSARYLLMKLIYKDEVRQLKETIETPAIGEAYA